MRHLYFFICTLLLFFLHVEVSAQTRTFKAGAIAGLNASQIDGDFHSGYNKVGFVGGLRGVAVLNDSWDLSFELLFSQRGSKSKSIGGSSSVTNPRKKRLEIDLNYGEAPILINFKTHDGWWDYKAIHLHGGVSYARLLNSKVDEGIPLVPAEDVNFGRLEDDFSKNSLSVLFGATFFLKQNFGITLRHYFSLNPLFEAEDSGQAGVRDLNSYHFTIQALYMLK